MKLVRIVSTAIMAVFAVIVVAFAISNRDPITLTLWPLPGDLRVPVYVLALGALALGFLWGGIATWLSAGRTRAKARQGYYQSDFLARENRYLRRKVEKAEEEGEHREAGAQPQALPPANAA